jgi:hypothetical protein
MFLLTLERKTRRRWHMTNAAGTNQPAPTRCPLSVQERKTSTRSEYFRLTDAVEKVENRTTPKIPQMLIFGLLRRCDAL